VLRNLEIHIKELPSRHKYVLVLMYSPYIVAASDGYSLAL